MDIVVGTAGHIDHGKTALVKALTGVDADRLPDEKRRGITIDIGFAEMTAGDVHFGFVDVPGHERFVRNMLAGASGIDLVLLVVAADEGVMPQTREHFDICRLLGLRHGVIALTKSDLADEETLELARLDVAELVAGSFLENAPVVAVSSRTGAGIDELRSTLAGVANFEREAERFTTFLPIDRSFSIKGFGTVVTGTLVSGTISEGDELTLLPNHLNVRVRGLQSHDQGTNTVTAGRRTAVNLAGVDHADVARGMVLTERGIVEPTQLIDCEIEMLPTAPRALRSRQRVRVHTGTAEVLARVKVLTAGGEIAPGDSDLVQLRLEERVTALPTQKLIIRSYSPQITIGGGTILDIAPAKHRGRDIAETREFLTQLRSAVAVDTQWLEALIESKGSSGASPGELRSRTGLAESRIKAAVEKLARKKAVVHLGPLLISPSIFAALRQDVLGRLHTFHRTDPLAKGQTREALQDIIGIRSDILNGVLELLVAEGQIVVDADTLRLTSHISELTGDDKKVSDALVRIYSEAKLEVPRLEEALQAATAGTSVASVHAKKLLKLLLARGEIVKVTDEFYFSRSALDDAVKEIRTFAGSTTERLIDVPKFKELTGISRKYAIPLLEHFDAERITRRVGDKRVVI